MENLPAVKQTFGITPKGIEEAIRLAKIMAASGLMPKALNSPEAVFVAMQMGAEIGLSPMASVQNIAVINGRPGIYGDAALAVVRASGLLEEFKEWQEGDRKTPKWTFYCRIKRKGYEATTGTYSWAEACEAGLDRADPASPWKKWTARMMQFKARNFAMRDQFADILKGIRTSEENYDAIDMEMSETGTFHSTSESTAQKAEGTLEREAFEVAASEKYPDGIGHLSEFVTESAAFYKTTEESIKSRAMDNWDGFCKAFEAWREKKYPTTTSPQETPTTEQAQSAGDAANVPEKPAESPAPPADPWQEKRSRYINLKGPGYSTFVFQNKAMFAEMPSEQRMEAIEKWVKLYPGQPWPLNADTEQKAEREPEKAPDQPQERPVSFTDEYKKLMDLKTKHPDVYAKARVEFNIAPDTIPHCVTLAAAMEDIIRALPSQSEPPVEAYQPPAVSDTSGF